MLKTFLHKESGKTPGGYGSGKGQRSLVRVFRVILIVLIPLLVFNILVSIRTAVSLRRQYLESITSFVNVYTRNEHFQLQAMQKFIETTVVNYPLMERVEDDSDFTRMNEAVASLMSSVSGIKSYVEQEQLYMIYLEKRDAIFNASTLTLSYDNYLSIKNYIRQLVDNGSIASLNNSWHTITLDGRIYLFYMISVTGRSLGVFIPAEDTIRPLSGIEIGDRGHIKLTLNDGTDFAFMGSEEMNTSLTASHLNYRSRDTKLPYDISITFDNLQVFGYMILPQLITSLTIPTICMILLIYVWYTYTRLIRPLHTFTQRLAGYDIGDEDVPIFSMENSPIQELQAASDRFKKLMDEVRRLRMDMYENELDRQKLEVAFLQSQIRPHFYLNCLTTISSMAILHRDEQIQEMIRLTSRYLRYLFSTDREYVALGLELDHIRDYFDIQSLRCGGGLEVDLDVDDGASKALVPPLMIFSFAENAIKHNDLTAGPLSVRIKAAVTKTGTGSDHLVIDITDTGRGFSAEELARIKEGRPKKDEHGTHLGIFTGIRRIHLLYPGTGDIHIFNDRESGAHIRIELPYTDTEEK